MLTAQEIFDTVWHKLNEQKVASVDDDGRCLYRGPNNTACAVGHLITDEEYTKEMDLDCGTPVYDLDALGLLPERLFPHIKLLSCLQSAHDSSLRAFGLYKWEFDMREIAERYNLKTPE